MAGRPVGKAARTRAVTFRITQEGGEHLDRLRGEQSVSDYVRWLIAQEMKRRT